MSELAALAGFLIFSVEKLQCAPAPFQSPIMGLGSIETTTPNSSAILWRRKRAIQRSSPMAMPSQGPTWNSHCKGRGRKWRVNMSFLATAILLLFLADNNRENT